MKILFIGGTGTISTECTNLAVQKGFDVTLLNRGKTQTTLPKDIEVIIGDINDEATISKLLENKHFDVIVNFIAFTPADTARDIRLFSQKTEQYIFISSASAYQKPLSNAIITESTPLANPFWEYSRNKIACEDMLMQEYRKNGFPITIVRPSHTYGNFHLPVALHGNCGSWQVVERILQDKPIIIPGDGLNWWTVTHNTDFAKGFVGLIGNTHAIGEAFHITSDEQLTWNDIHNSIGKALGKSVKAVHISAEMLVRFVPEWEGTLIGDKSNSVNFDNSKVKRAVPDYMATTRFDQGARQAIKYIMAHDEFRKLDPQFDAFCDDIISKIERL